MHDAKVSKNRKICICCALLLISAIILGVLGNRPDTVADYTELKNWAIYAEGEGSADLFFVCPTVDKGRNGNFNMSLDDEKTKEKFVGASLMELGIYSENSVVYVPYYKQETFLIYSMTEDEASPYLKIAYSDVKAAFETYLKNCDMNRPLILAGFSQGAEMVIKLLKDFGNNPCIKNRLVAAYAIGWRLTQEEVEKYPWLVPATGEDDTGCIVIINSEAETVTDSLPVPEGTWTYGINPLNWKTDSTPADKSMNLGACFTDYSGAVTSEIPELTGAFIDPQRGTLKCPDIDPAEYSNNMFPDGVYHMYDYQFFYRNLQKNVSVRLQSWEQKIVNVTENRYYGSC